MVTPAPGNLQVAWRETLEPEARALDEGDRGGVLRLDVCLDAVQPHPGKRVSEHQAHALGHVTLAFMGPTGVVAEVGAVEHTADNLAHGEDAEDGAVGEPADQEALDVRLATATHPRDEGSRIGGWHHPTPMECATGSVQRNDLLGVATRGLPQIDPFADLERISLIRFRHAGPSVAEPR